MEGNYLDPLIDKNIIENNNKMKDIDIFFIGNRGF